MTKKVVVRIFGGLGNQLFCYAVAKKIALNNNAELIIDNTSGFEKDSYNRKYLLNNFNIKSRFANNNERFFPYTRYVYSILRRFNKLLKFSNRFYIQHEGAKFDNRVLEIKVKKILYLEACWQSEKYFFDIKNIIKNDLELNLQLNNENIYYLKLIQNTNSVCLHIRFFDNNIIGPNNIIEDYYKNAINYVNKNIDNPIYFIFSDNLSLAKKKLNPLNFNFHYIKINTHCNDPIFDFNLMKNCKYFIISNSTFSWWAAWLSNNPNKLVVAPDYKITESKETITSWGFDGLIPDQWIKLK